MQQQVTVLKSEKLRSISNASHTAEVIIVALSQRERLRNFTDMTRLKNELLRKGERVVDTDFCKFFEDMEAAGTGTISYGKNDKQDRFYWHYSMKKIAQAALEGKDVPASRIEIPKVAAEKAKEQIAARDKVKAAPKKIVKLSLVAKKAVENSSETKQVSRIDRFVYIPLRKDFSLEFTIPSDLSKDEIEIISRALGRLSA